jgi:hypothetical protein
MSALTLVSIEERRYAALIGALRLALFALNIAPRFKAGLTNSYRIASLIERALYNIVESPYGAVETDGLNVTDDGRSP